MTIPLWQWSAGDLAQALRGKTVSCREVVQAHLDRISAVNPKVNAVTLVLAEDALHSAAAADRKIAAGEDLGPLTGVPITVKETIDLAGSATAMGIPALKDRLPERDAPVIVHLKQAGAIPIGRTNVPGFGAYWHCDNDLHGATLNPWDPARTPGGSSGGEAAVLATGMSPLGIGNDMGGSLRFPAQCCGIAALLPSAGRISRIATAIFPDAPLFYSQVAAANGPLARHVADLRLALEVMSQPDPSDPGWTPAARLGSDLPGPVRVALTTDAYGCGSDPAVAAAVRKAGAVLLQAGYLVEEVELPSVAAAGETLETIANTESESYLASMLPMMSTDGQTILKGIVGDPKPNLASYMKAIGERYRIAQDWSLFMEDYPLVLGPVSTFQAFNVGDDLKGAAWLRRFMLSLRLTEACNLLGLPSVALPVQLAEGLPQGVQVIARRFHEDLCLDAAEAIEAAQGVFTPIEPKESFSR